MEGITIVGYIVVDKHLNPISHIMRDYNLVIQSTGKALDDLLSDGCSVLTVSGTWRAMGFDEAMYKGIL